MSQSKGKDIPTSERPSGFLDAHVSRVGLAGLQPPRRAQPSREQEPPQPHPWNILDQYPNGPRPERPSNGMWQMTPTVPTLYQVPGSRHSPSLLQPAYDRQIQGLLETSVRTLAKLGVEKSTRRRVPPTKPRHRSLPDELLSSNVQRLCGKRRRRRQLQLLSMLRPSKTSRNSKGSRTVFGRLYASRKKTLRSLQLEQIQQTPTHREIHPLLSPSPMQLE